MSGADLLILLVCGLALLEAQGQINRLRDELKAERLRRKDGRFDR